MRGAADEVWVGIQNGGLVLQRLRGAADEVWVGIQDGGLDLQRPPMPLDDGNMRGRVGSVTRHAPRPSDLVSPCVGIQDGGLDLQRLPMPFDDENVMRVYFAMGRSGLELTGCVAMKKLLFGMRRVGIYKASARNCESCNFWASRESNTYRKIA